MSSSPDLPQSVDLFVVGAGTAGAALAGAAAQRGLSVLCIDRGPLDGAGARWVNGVAREAFVAAGVPAPTGEELRGDDKGFHMFAGWGPERILMRGHGVLEVDMRCLVTRLQGRARERGAQLEGGVEVGGVDADGAVRTSAGSVRARFVADASGHTGARLLDSPPIARGDLCAAAQAVHSIADPEGARAFLEEHGVAPGETLCFTGVAGGYSIVNATVHGDTVSLLTGSIPATGHPSGKALLDRFVEARPWIGEKRFGGQRAIPLGRPRDRMAAGRVALIGDAAGQVFSAHGSGIGPGMVAARLLAETLADGGEPEDYAVRWMRQHGGLFAGYDVFRRFSQTLSIDRMQRLMRLGVMDAETAAAGLGQRLPQVGPARAVSIAARVARAPREAASLAAVGGRMSALMGLYAAYPQRETRRASWVAAVRALHGGRLGRTAS